MLGDLIPARLHLTTGQTVMLLTMELVMHALLKPDFRPTSHVVLPVRLQAHPRLWSERGEDHAVVGSAC